MRAQRGAARQLILSLAAAAAIFAVRLSSPPSEGAQAAVVATPTATRSLGAQNDAAAELERLKSATAASCSPGHRWQALQFGTGPICTPWDSIPSIDHPTFINAARVNWLPGNEAVVALDVGKAHRAYPARFLVFHEIVNDTVAGRPVVISFCPLCYSATAFSRRVAGRTLTFGVSGQLNVANQVMFDRQTITTWQQITGQALVGPLEGHSLKEIPVEMASFADWRAAHPNGLVMTLPKDGPFAYGTDPYGGYSKDPTRLSPFVATPDFADGGPPIDARLAPEARVIGALVTDVPIAFAEPSPRGQTAVERAAAEGVHLIALFRFGVAQEGTGSTLSSGRQGWSGEVFEATVGSRVLALLPHGDTFIDPITGSSFDVFGHADTGPLAGTQLLAVPQLTAYWFAWSSFFPRTDLVR